MSILARVKAWALFLLAGLVLLGGAFLSGRSKGKRQAEVQARAQELERVAEEQKVVVETVQRRHQVEDLIERKPIDEVREELRRNWTRP